MNERILWKVIKAARERRGLDQTQAAKLLGIAQPNLSERESGRVGISEDTLIKTARAYGTTVREMLLEELTQEAPERPGPAKTRAKKID